MNKKIQPEEIAALARALAQLNAEPDRPQTKIACEQELAKRLGIPWSTITTRIQVLRFRVVPGPRVKGVKPRAWGDNWKPTSAKDMQT